LANCSGRGLAPAVAPSGPPSCPPTRGSRVSFPRWGTQLGSAVAMPWSATPSAAAPASPPGPPPRTCPGAPTSSVSTPPRPGASRPSCRAVWAGPCGVPPVSDPRPPMSRASRVAVRALQAYQGAASGRVSPCRFYPSCSTYAAEAFAEHGFWRGLSLTARRLLRCRPFGPHGVDLVPLPVHVHGPRRQAGTRS
jgi:hypothetical protein